MMERLGETFDYSHREYWKASRDEEIVPRVWIRAENLWYFGYRAIKIMVLGSSLNPIHGDEIDWDRDIFLRLDWRLQSPEDLEITSPNQSSETQWS